MIPDDSGIKELLCSFSLYKIDPPEANHNFRHFRSL